MIQMQPFWPHLAGKKGKYLKHRLTAFTVALQFSKYVLLFEDKPIILNHADGCLGCFTEESVPTDEGWIEEYEGVWEVWTDTLMPGALSKGQHFKRAAPGTLCDVCE